MNREVVVAGVLVLALTSAAHARQTIAVPGPNVAPGGTVNVTLTGTGGEQYALVGSSVSRGFSYAGVALTVGTDVTILSLGVIPAGGSVVIPVTPPIPQLDRYYVQGVTSASGFASITATNAVVLINSEVTRLFQGLGGGVTAAGTGFALSPGVTVTKTAVGTYRIDYPTQNSTGSNLFPTITPTAGGSPTSVVANNATMTVTFPADTAFYFALVRVLR